MADYIQHQGPNGPINDWGAVRSTRTTIFRGAKTERLSWDMVEVHSPDGIRYQFAHHESLRFYSTYTCNQCKLLKAEYRHDPEYGATAIIMKMPSIKVFREEGGQLRHWSNPLDPTQPHICIGLTFEHSEGKEMKQEAKLIASSSTMRPKQAFEEVVRRVHRGAHANKLQILRHLGSYKRNNKSSIGRASRIHPPIQTVEGIPRELCLTFADLNDNDGVNAQEYIFFKQNDPPFIIIGSRADLQILYESELWCSDGTFDFCPIAPVDQQRVTQLLEEGNANEARRVKGLKFSQLYSIHGFVRGECKTGVIALLPDKTQATYERLFYLGGEGTLALNSVRSDFELAVFNAIANVGAVFDMEIDCGGCTFHFTQSIHRNVQFKGLQELYNRSPRYNGERYERTREWIRQLDAMCLFPVEYTMLMWDNHLSQPPLTLDPEIDGKSVELATYFHNQWLQNDERIRWYNYWNRPGPRTNNHVEAWNGTLKYWMPAIGPLSLTKFLTAYQLIQLDKETRVNELRNGDDVANERAPEYIINDEMIAENKEHLAIHVAEYEANVIDVNIFCDLGANYLLRQAHHLGRH